IYEFWYDTPQEFPFKEYEEELKGLKDGAPDPELESVVSAVESYSQTFHKAAAPSSAPGSQS
ncbi:MAG TPA: hypothetical protein VHU81_09980, partial [Thermoanaerobaculia bacterium]|nr:hypothetical protein [Thermoanaerobaculia bacterium]